jgi:membrane-associated protein
VAGIMLGDSIPYWAGRHWGKRLLKKRPFSWFITCAGLAKTETFFKRYGSLTVFIGRFLAGLRMPIFFMSGSMGTPYWRFAGWDMLGALISCPTSILLAYAYGKDAEEILRKNHIYLYIVLGLIAAYIVYHIYSHRPKKDTPPPASSDVEESPSV